MAIEFPNISRRYDATQRCVRFSGYDGAMEKSFFLKEDAIWRLDLISQNTVETLLDVFDRNRDQIYEVATQVYKKYGGASIIIVAKDFDE
jgi:hypothetical protein